MEIGLDQGHGDARFDVAIIGAGVIGCAMARRFTLEGARVVVLEKATDVLDGASKGNSAILHTGFDAPENSLELTCVRQGYAEYRQIHEALNLPLDPCGALVLAWSEEQEAELAGLMAQARRNGIDDLERLDRAQVLQREPNLAEGVVGGFRVPGESLIDPWSAPHAYLLQALLNGAELRLGCALQEARFEGDRWQLRTSRGEVVARTVINCAGLYGDRVEEMLLGGASFRLHPRKGQFIVYDKSAGRLLQHIVLPVPTPITKGVVVCRTVYGNLLVGPTAEEQDDRDAALLEQDKLEQLRARGEAILPALAGHPVTALYAGLRPATERKDYRITAHPLRHYIAVGGIRSTGLSSALGTARYVYALYERELGAWHGGLAEPVLPRMPNISECAPRAWQAPGNGGIVCHCERVTRGEIEAALGGPLAAHTLAGLKRRTRVTMGRCQGYYCSAALAELTEGRLDPPLGERLPGGHGHA
ncbi:NAD(P)/FAD-dependent oxidoreductase [Stutzerimonas azotifigens]|uniref:NAD(P)/FAD-dependent oxidoreductase n=1 Tax=Stutzerimonas azotifigens TaxID=291995 RepID=UPI000409C9F7|nr:NAD(P)/FAD-dependent oxidoreductase [Stutzerimonas azotifigens]